MSVRVSSTQTGVEIPGVYAPGAQLQLPQPTQNEQEMQQPACDVTQLAEKIRELIKNKYGVDTPVLAQQLAQSYSGICAQNGIDAAVNAVEGDLESKILPSYALTMINDVIARLKNRPFDMLYVLAAGWCLATSNNPRCQEVTQLESTGVNLDKGNVIIKADTNKVRVESDKLVIDGIEYPIEVAKYVMLVLSNRNKGAILLYKRPGEDISITSDGLSKVKIIFKYYDEAARKSTPPVPIIFIPCRNGGSAVVSARWWANCCYSSYRFDFWAPGGITRTGYPVEPEPCNCSGGGLAFKFRKFLAALGPSLDIKLATLGSYCKTRILGVCVYGSCIADMYNKNKAIYACGEINCDIMKMADEEAAKELAQSKTQDVLLFAEQLAKLAKTG